MSKTVCLDFCPVLNLIRGDILCVHRLVIAGPGIGSRSTYCRHEFIVLVGDGQTRSFQRDTVYLPVDGFTFKGICRFPVDLEQFLYPVQHGLFKRIILSSETLSTFEH